jgi:ATP-binding cassette, subfamily B, bacterial
LIIHNRRSTIGTGTITRGQVMDRSAGAVQARGSEPWLPSPFASAQWEVISYAARRERWWFVATVLSCLAAAIGAVGIMVASAWLISVLLGPDLRPATAMRAALLVAVVVGVTEIASFTVNLVSSRLGLALEERLRQDLIAAAHRRTDQDINGGVRTQFLTSGYTSELIITSFALVGVRVLSGVFATALLALLAWWLPLLVLTALLLARRASRRMFMVSTAAAVGRGRAQDEVTYLVDLALSPRAAKEWRIFDLQRFILAELAARWRLLVQSSAPDWSAIGTPALASTLLGGTTGAVIVVVAMTAASGTLSLPLVVLLIQAILGGRALTLFSGADLAIARGGPDLADAIRSAGAGGRRPGDSPVKVAANVTVRGPRIVVEDLTFAYPGSSRPALDNLNLTIEAGRCTAVVGPNGAGKSSLLRVIQGFAEPQDGIVHIDGVDLADLPPATWWRQLATVRQDFVQYPLSLYDNIDLSGVASRPDVESAARRAGLDQVVVGLPAGFDTDLGGGGGTELSGGQWQRIALARALCAVDRGAQVVLLDEPTAALDARAELQVFTSLLAELAGRTVVLVSHRLASVRLADHIIVLDEGRVVEQGDHRALMDHGGYYAHAFRTQADRYL